MSFRPHPPEQTFHPAVERFLDRLADEQREEQDRRWAVVSRQLDEMQLRAQAEREAAERKVDKQMDLFNN